MPAGASKRRASDRAEAMQDAQRQRKKPRSRKKATLKEREKGNRTERHRLKKPGAIVPKRKDVRQAVKDGIIFWRKILHSGGSGDRIVVFHDGLVVDGD